MYNTLSKVLIFTLGAGVGSVVTWKLLETRYQRISQEEIDSVRAYYSEKYDIPDMFENTEEDTDDENEGVVDPTVTSNIREYASILNSENYVDYSNNGINAEKKEVDNVNKPYVISPDEFDEKGYDTITLFYTADGVVIDTENKIIKDYEDLIGPDALDTFGEYEDDSVFVRDDEKQIDYEVLLDPREYEVIINRNAHSSEG